MTPRTLWLIATFALLSACMHPRAIDAPADVQLTPLKTISTVKARLLLTLAGVDGIPVTNAVDCYRMQYTVGSGTDAVRLSGLLALPRDAVPRRLVSFQHGTSTTRAAVPSQLDGTGIAAAIAFAGNGYVADSIGPAVVGMIESSRRVQGVPGGPVFLSGFSEGGWASLAALRILEADGKRVLGSAQVTGAYNLRHVSLPAALKGGARSHSLYLAYAAWGQAAYYGHPLDSVLTSEYATTVERLFAGARPKEILATLPQDPRRMFNQAFLDAFDRNEAHWYLESFAANSLVDVTPHAPVRLYYGSKDLDVVPEEALTAARAMRARQADVSAIDVGEVGHDPSMLAAAPLILAWLAELDAKVQP